ncbi:hypothetical protein IE81DRAFT_348368 [Ceraceosorus guamensis]|uniref:Uncharacterized protein n=1 Tax=Ceraceosorus guamensis TaxID=1522189 RepID=A0A316VVF8_9BASI|nr:hypothetical protein IE81DRAFT_348368 [Ceraceosorus guamensis]PWN41432.1 hypothetical protein IE81DRAFT_348368 [Ceraceosorus guamensis]
MPSSSTSLSPVESVRLRLDTLTALVQGPSVQQRAGASLHAPGLALADQATFSAGEDAGVDAKISERSIASRLSQAQEALNDCIGAHKSLIAFAQTFDQNRPWLIPIIPLQKRSVGCGGEDEKAEEGGEQNDDAAARDLGKMAVEERDGLLMLGGLEERATIVIEAERDIKQLGRDMNAIKELQRFAEGGRLGELQDLRPMLDQLIARLSDASESRSELDSQVLSLVDQYGEWVRMLSSLFVSWDEGLSELERRVTQLERLRATAR